MSPSTCPNGFLCPALDDVNDRIRALLSEPAIDARAEQYRLLLNRWADLTHDDIERAT